MIASEPELVCPTCGLPPDRHTELLPVERRILRCEDATLVVNGLISEKDYESARAEQLLCPNGHAFPVPPSVALRYA